MAEHKYVKLRKTLTKFIQENPPGTALPSFTDMIRKYRVTYGTIDKVMQELDHEGLVDRHQGRGVFVSEKAHDKMIAIVFCSNIWDSMAGPFYRILMMHLQKYATAHQKNAVLFCDVPDTDHPGAENLFHKLFVREQAAGRLQGILVGNIAGQNQEYWLKSQGVPVVGIGPYSYVEIDCQTMIQQGVRYLAEKGCKRVWISPGIQLNSDYLNAFTTELKKYGMEEAERSYLDFKVDVSFANPEYFQCYSRKFTESLLAAAGGKLTLEDGILSADDEFCNHVVKEFAVRGFSAGEDYRVASHANKGSPTLAWLEGRIGRMEVDVEELAAVMYGCLDQLCRGETVGKILIPTRMAV